MEVYKALELLSQGLGNSRPVADCTQSLRELHLGSKADSTEDIKLQGSSAQCNSGLPSGTSGHSGLPSGTSGHGLRGGGLDSGPGELASIDGPPLSRPISAPPNLGAISASTLFAYPPAESAGCVDFLLGDIRYDEQYCEFYRNHARDNPSLPKPLEEPSLIELLPRLRTRAANKGAKDDDGLSAASASKSVPASPKNRESALAVATAALLGQGNPANVKAAGIATTLAEGRETGATAPKQYETAKAHQQQQQTWGGSYTAAGTPAAASRAATTTTRATYSGSSTERCNPNGEEEVDGDFASGTDWGRKNSFGGDDALNPPSRGGTPFDTMWVPTPLLDAEAAAACLPAFPTFYAAQQLAGAVTGAVPLHDLELPVGALLRAGNRQPTLGGPLMGAPGLCGAYVGASGALSTSASNPVGEVLPRETMALQQRNLLAAQQAAAAAWLMGRQGHLSPVAAEQAATAGTATDAWVAAANQRLQAALELGVVDSAGPSHEQFQRRQPSTRHAREQRRPNRTENALFEQYDATLGWGKTTAMQQGLGSRRDGRGVAELPLFVPNGKSRIAPNENGIERLGTRGKYSYGKGGTSSGSSCHEEERTPTRFAVADVLQADDDSLFRTAKDQGGCRLLQQRLAEGTFEEVDRVFNMAFSRLVELMTDAYGNYLFQKLLEVCSDKQLEKLLQAVTPQLQDICLDPHGTRAAQKLVEVICGTRRNPSLTAKLTSAFEPLVVELATNANGNHVIKRFLCCSTRENGACNIDFILEAACNHCVPIATEPHGCCVMQRCCEAATGTLKDRLLAEVASNALLLSQDPFGNYVVQHVLRHDHARIGTQITMQLRGHIRELSKQKFASNVVEKCLLWGDGEQRAQAIGELLEDPQGLQQLVLHAYGNYVVQRALAVAGPTQRDALFDVVRFGLLHQHSSQHSRIAQKFMRRFRGLRQPPGTPAGASSSTGSWCCSPPQASGAAATQMEWGATEYMQLETVVSSGQVSPSGLQAQVLCQRQQREHPVDSRGALKLLSGESSMEGAEFGFRPVSPL